ncbi:MAG TPA: DnaJ C-terminal domain-containing protein [bacterium]|nr:DnaJ C-terminal domain-containing protein [bacterium]
MEFKDYYNILEVERTADQKAISQAFRKLARRLHPDVNPGDKQAEARFKEVNEAYQVLNDPERRAKYDQLLDLRQRGGGWEDLLHRGRGSSGDGTYTVYGSPEDLGSFSDFFRQLFGEFGGGGLAEHLGRGGQGRSRRGGVRGEEFARRRGGGAGPQTGGQDVEGTVEITLEDAYRGTARTVTIPAGGGREHRSIEVTIPKGVRSGQRIRVAGQGQGGDLYLLVQIAQHPTFTRQDDDVLCEVAVPVWTAALGGTIEAPTLGGPVTVTIPPGTRDARTFRLRERGLPHLRGTGAGDELVKVRLSLPEPLSPRDRELLEEMRRLHEVRANS